MFNGTAIEDPFPLWLKAPTPLLQECEGLGLFLWDEMLYLQSFDNCERDQFQKTFSCILYCSIHNCQSILVALLSHNSSKVGTTTLSLSNCYHFNHCYHYHHYCSSVTTWSSRWEPQHGCSTSSLSQISRRCRRKKLDNIYTWRFFLLFLNSSFDSIFWQTETINTLRCHNFSLWALRTSRYHRLQRRQSRSPW